MSILTMNGSVPHNLVDIVLINSAFAFTILQKPLCKVNFVCFHVVAMMDHNYHGVVRIFDESRHKGALMIPPKPHSVFDFHICLIIFCTPIHEEPLEVLCKNLPPTKEEQVA